MNKRISQLLSKYITQEDGSLPDKEVLGLIRDRIHDDLSHVPYPSSKEFKVVTTSDNTNSFGLYGHIFMSEDGETWEAARNEKLDTGSKITLAYGSGVPSFGNAGFEIPHRLPDAPDGVIKEVWGN